MEQVGDKPVTPVAVMNERPEQPGPETRKVARIGEVEEQMKMVAHEAVMVQRQGQAFLVAADELEEVGEVLLLGKEGLPVVAGIHDVIASGPGSTAGSGASEAWDGFSEGIWYGGIYAWLR